jgi:hypothetical protein
MDKLKKIFLENKLNLVLLIIFIVLFTLLILIKFSYYPMASVNKTIISEKKLNTNTQAIYYYYNNYLKKMIDEELKTTTSTKELSYQEIEALALDDLITKTLIHQEIEKKIGKNKLNELITQKINEHFNNDLKKISLVMYNLNPEDFKNEILIPQAETDILSGRLFLEGKKFDEWLKEARQKAQIKIFNPKFKWDGEKIKINQ